VSGISVKRNVGLLYCLFICVNYKLYFIRNFVDISFYDSRHCSFRLESTLFE